MTRDELKTYFYNNFSSIISVKLIMETTTRSKGYGFIEFTSFSEFQRALYPKEDVFLGKQKLVFNSAKNRFDSFDEEDEVSFAESQIKEVNLREKGNLGGKEGTKGEVGKTLGAKEGRERSESKNSAEKSLRSQEENERQESVTNSKSPVSSAPKTPSPPKTPKSSNLNPLSNSTNSSSTNDDSTPKKEVSSSNLPDPLLSLSSKSTAVSFLSGSSKPQLELLEERERQKFHQNDDFIANTIADGLKDIEYNYLKFSENREHVVSRAFIYYCKVLNNYNC